MSERYKSTKRCYLIDHHSPPAPAITFDNLDMSEYAAFFKEARIDMLMLYCKDHWGYAWYPTSVAEGEMHPALPFDYVGEVSRTARDMGIEFTAYYSFEYDTRAARNFPGWRVQRPDGAYVIRDDRYAKWPLCCMRTGYRRYCMEQLVEIVTRYKPDSLFLDIFGMSLCYCPSCRAAYKERFLSELPEGEAALIENRQQVLQFLFESEKALLSEVRRALKAIDPSLAITINFSSHYPEEIREMLDYQFCEPVLGDNWFSAAFARDTAAGTYPLMMPGEFSAVYNYPDKERYITGLSEIAAQGCRAGMYSGSQRIDGSLEMAEARYVGAAYRVIKEMQPFIEGRSPLRYAAILQSDRSNAVGGSDFPQDSILRLKRSEPHRKAILGAMRLCEHAKIPWCVVPEKTALAQGLSDYSVVLLPEVYVVPEGLCKVLWDFVENGGLVLSAYDAAMFADDLCPLENNALADLLGIRVVKKNRAYAQNDWGAYLRRTSGFAPGRLAFTTPPVSGEWNEACPEGSQVLLEFVPPCTPVSGELWVNWWSPPPGRSAAGAALTKKETGLGAALYAAFDLFGMACNDDYPYLHELFEAIVGMAPRQPDFRIKMECPDILRANFSRRGNTIYIHEVSSLPHHYGGDCPETPGGVLTVAPKVPILSARQVYPVQRELKVTREAKNTIIMLPASGVNSIVEINLK